MIKTIHCIKVGPFNLSNHELSCIESWKKIYPDFMIKYWDTSDCYEAITDCEFALKAFNEGKFNYAIDYFRLKILYDEGGLYLDTDVLALNRVPDNYFEKAFLPWDSNHCATWTNNGCATYTEPRNQMFAEFIEEYKKLDWDNSFKPNNDIIDKVLKKHGLKIEKAFLNNKNDLNLKNLTIVNRNQFGVFDVKRKVMDCEGKTPYFLHCYQGSWLPPKDSKIAFYYAPVNQDTNIDFLLNRLNRFLSLKKKPELNFEICLFLNTLDSKFNDVISYLNYADKTPNIIWDVIPVGHNLPDKEFREDILDIVGKKFSNIKYCRNILNKEGDSFEELL